jgi:hypothetical protein
MQEMLKTIKEYGKYLWPGNHDPQLQAFTFEHKEGQCFSDIQVVI